MPIVFPPNLIQLGGGNVTVNADGSITLSPAAGTNVTLSGKLVSPSGALIIQGTNTGGAADLLSVQDTNGNVFFSLGSGGNALVRVPIADQGTTGGQYNLQVGSGRMIVGPAGSVEWRASSGGTIDTVILRDAANTLAQRNGANAQEQRWYNTFTDASNYERGFARWSSNEFLLGAEKGGTGTLRNVVVPNTLVVRQPGGTAGTNEVQISHDGTNLTVINKGTGAVILQGKNNGAGAVVSDNPTGSYWQLVQNANSFRTYNSGQYSWSSGGGADGTLDTGLSRAAAAVVKPTDSGSGAGWFQNTAGRARVTADVTNATATMSNLSDLSITLKAGRKYVGQFVFFANDSTGADGLAFDLNGGAATFTSLEFGFTAQPAGSTLGTVTSTAAGTAITLTVVSTSDAVYTVSFACVCNAAGTFIPRVAQNSHSTGTATVRLGSYVIVEDSPS